MALPLSSHPIFHLRKATIIIAIIGVVLCCLSSSQYYYYNESLATSAVFLGLSAILCTVDLISYATKKVEHPDKDPEWPTRKWIIVDAIMAVLLQFVFWCTIVGLADSYGYDNTIIGAYAALADFSLLVGLHNSRSSVVLRTDRTYIRLLHGWCFWKQVMACYKKRWLARLSRQPCVRCGYVEDDSNAVPPHPHSHDQPPNTFTYAGPSAEFRRANIVTPESPESTMEQGLLIGSDFGSGYGSIDCPEPTLEQPEEVVVGKGKKKKISNGTCDKKPDKEVAS